MILLVTSTCQKGECEKLVYSQGLCKSHYNAMILQTRPDSAAKRRTYIREYMRARRNGGDPGPEGLMRQPARGLTCAVEDCEDEVKSRGWCVKHYTNWKRHGVPVLESPSAEDRFWALVDRRGDDECWPWKGRISRNGYGQFKVDRKQVLVHRWAYEYFVKPIPSGLTIDHVWDNGCVLKYCVNWLHHLEPVTMKENDRRARARRAAEKRQAA